MRSSEEKPRKEKKERKNCVRCFSLFNLNFTVQANRKSEKNTPHTRLRTAAHTHRINPLPMKIFILQSFKFFTLFCIQKCAKTSKHTRTEQHKTKTLPYVN